MSAMKRLFQLMSDKKASDIFLSVGAPINIKINGVAMPVNQAIMNTDAIKQLLYEVLNERQIREFEEEMELNTAFALEGVGAFRISAFRQKGSPAVVVRFIPGSIPGLDTLGVPEVLKEVIMQKRGLILMVGATGSGKSTTLAAMLELRNRSLPGHILTIEEPIEFLFQSKKCVVNQREIGRDTESLQVALRNALRQSPDCIMIGEIRDRETMTAALSYALSGHLVLASMHANNSHHALGRILSFYAPESRQVLLADLAAGLRAIVSQRLLRAEAGGRIPAVEVLFNSNLVAELIMKGDFHAVHEAMEKSLAEGSITFEEAIALMVRDGVVSRDEGLSHADSVTNLVWRLQNDATPVSRVSLKREESDQPVFTDFTVDVLPEGFVERRQATSTFPPLSR